MDSTVLDLFSHIGYGRDPPPHFLTEAIEIVIRNHLMTIHQHQVVDHSGLPMIIQAIADGSSYLSHAFMGSPEVFCGCACITIEDGS